MLLLLLVGAMSVAVSYGQAGPHSMLAAPPLDPDTQKKAEVHMRELHEFQRINGAQRVTFRSKWVSQTAIYNTKPSIPAIQVEVTDTTSDYALDIGTRIVLEMVKFIYSTIFNKMASQQVSLGIFSHLDDGGVTVFPEFAQYRDRPECADTCAGSCYNTCTSDGRKYESLAGLATITLAAVHEDTILCNWRDPYRGKLNVAVHEFAHSLHLAIQYMISPYRPNTVFDTQIENAYYNAHGKAIWDVNSYAMDNEYEYWAVATGTFFNTDQTTAAGGMNMCDGISTTSCTSQVASRAHLSSKDRQLYNALIEILLNLNENLYSNLRTCMK